MKGARKPGNGRDMLVPAHHICNVTNAEIVNPAENAAALHHSGAHAGQHVDQQLARCIRARKHVDVVVRHGCAEFVVFCIFQEQRPRSTRPMCSSRMIAI